MDEKGRDLIFMSNFDKAMLPHYIRCCREAGLHAVIKNNAVDALGRPMDECYAFYVYRSQYNSPEQNKFYDLYIDVEKAYKQILLENGTITQRFADTHFCYLGIEQVYDLKNIEYNEFSPDDTYNLDYTNSIHGEVPDKNTW